MRTESVEFAVTRIEAGLGRPAAGRVLDDSAKHATPIQLDRAAFVFSLDFELGVASVDDRRLYRALSGRIEGARRAIPLLLRLLERYNISATWATVGHLFRSSDALDLTVDQWVYQEMPAEHRCAPDMIDAIMRCRVPQDIGCHTYRHLNMASLELDDAILSEELVACRRLAARRGLDMTSFVFPFNCVGRLELLARSGFTSFRGANSEWYVRWITGQHPLMGKLCLFLKRVDDLLALAPPVDLPRRTVEGLIRIPHSMFYGGQGRGLCAVPIRCQVKKAERGLRRAVRGKAVLHLWTHPQNLGTGTQAALDGLETVFAAVARYRNEGRLEALSMRQLAELVNDRQGGGGVKAAC